jgi:hypothetical protein
MIRSALSLIAVALLAACSSTTSDNVSTNGINADIDVFANGSGRTWIDVEFEVGDGLGGTSLELAAGDRLTATANGIQKTLTEDVSVIGRFRYETTFDFDDAGTVFTVSFSRDRGVNAPNSTVMLPEGFTVQSPQSNDVFGQAEDIPIQWTPNGTTITPDIDVTLSCTTTGGIVFSASEDVTTNGDSGVASLPVAAVIPIGTLDETRLCEGEVHFSRWRRGSLDSAYGEGGDITAEHIKRAQFFVDLSL